MSSRVATGANSFLSRQGGRVGDAARQVGSAIIPLPMDRQRIKIYFEDKYNVGGWQYLVKVAGKGVSSRGSTGRETCGGVMKPLERAEIRRESAREGCVQRAGEPSNDILGGKRGGLKGTTYLWRRRNMRDLRFEYQTTSWRALAGSQGGR